MQLGQQLQLERCPHCGIHLPTLERQVETIRTQGFERPTARHWGVYACKSCGGIVVAWAWAVPGAQVERTFPQQNELSEEIPARAREYLRQAQDSLHAPDGAIMLAASAVDAMLKAKGYQKEKDSLNSRIRQAANDHLITADMALWAHQVRLEANNPRHADDEEPHATPERAEQAVEFAAALANILFVLPARVTRGLKEAGGTPVEEGGKLPETE